MIEILIAEDNEIIREEIASVLTGSGRMHVAASVASGKEAAGIYTDSIDIVLMDIEMESMHAGLDAASEIMRKDPEACIIYLTSHDDEKIVIEALATGAKDYIVKGLPDKDFIEHIVDVHEGRPRLEGKIQRVMMGEVQRLRQSEKNLLYFIQNISTLTPAEEDLIGCFLAGMKVREIADRRCVETTTVKSQIRTLLQKFGASRSSEIVKIVEGLGLAYLFPKH